MKHYQSEKESRNSFSTINGNNLGRGGKTLPAVPVIQSNAIVQKVVDEKEEEPLQGKFITQLKSNEAALTDPLLNGKKMKGKEQLSSAQIIKEVNSFSIQRMMQSDEEVESDIEEDRHPDSSTANWIDEMENISDIVTDEFLQRHISTKTIQDAESQADKRLSEQHYAYVSTVMLMNEDDIGGLVEEVKYRNQIEFYGTQQNYRSLYPIEYVTVYKDGTPKEIGTKHFFYNVTKNGKVYIISHLDRME